MDYCNKILSLFLFGATFLVWPCGPRVVPGDGDVEVELRLQKTAGKIWPHHCCLYMEGFLNLLHTSQFSEKSHSVCHSEVIIQCERCLSAKHHCSGFLRLCRQILHVCVHCSAAHSTQESTVFTPAISVLIYQPSKTKLKEKNKVRMMSYPEFGCLSPCS